jgi:small subunit ribosomal protein S6
MPAETPTYDLMLLLSTGVEEERRAKILGDVEGAISGAEGSIVHDADWGTRPLAYRIDHQAEAEYHLLQFQGPTSLLESLGHTLGITDGVLRHRIIKVLPGTPPPPSPDRVAVPAAPPAPASEADVAAPPAADVAPPPAADVAPPPAADVAPPPAADVAAPPAPPPAPAEEMPPSEPASAESAEPDATAEPASPPPGDEAGTGE